MWPRCTRLSFYWSICVQESLDLVWGWSTHHNDLMNHEPNIRLMVTDVLDFPGGSAIKNPLANVGDMGSIPGLGRSPGKGNDNPFQYSCLGNPMDRGAWLATVHGISKESDTTLWLNDNMLFPTEYFFSRKYETHYKNPDSVVYRAIFILSWV